MELKKINGGTYYLPAATNIGLYLFKDKYTLLIDTGGNNQQAKKISDAVTDNSMNIKYIINTHNHVDHTGGNIFFREHHPGCVIYASGKERLFMENDFLFPMYIYGGDPIRELARHFIRAKQVAVDFELHSGVVKINDEKFEIIPLPGHARGQVGIATRDRVCFLGDGLFSREIIEKYSFPFLLNIREQLQTFSTIKELDYDYYVLSHAPRPYNAGEIKALVDTNAENLHKFLDLALELLTQPKTREELLEEIVILEDLRLDFKEYHYSLSTTAAIIAYLYELGQLDYQIENGKLYYYRV